MLLLCLSFTQETLTSSIKAIRDATSSSPRRFTWVIKAACAKETLPPKAPEALPGLSKQRRREVTPTGFAWPLKQTTAPQDAADGSIPHPKKSSTATMSHPTGFAWPCNKPSYPRVTAGETACRSTTRRGPPEEKPGVTKGPCQELQPFL